MCADTTDTTAAPDYKSTLNLPKTDFPMRAGLPKREPEWLARWERIGIYDRLREKALAGTGEKGKPTRTPFTLHDGPPYANGHLHIGHALNKTLKDMVVRSQQMMGHDARLYPRLGLPRSAHRVEDRRAIPRQGPRQGRRGYRRFPSGMPQVCRRLGGHPTRGIQTPRHHG